MDEERASKARAQVRLREFFIVLPVLVLQIREGVLRCVGHVGVLLALRLEGGLRCLGRVGALLALRLAHAVSHREEPSPSLRCAARRLRSPRKRAPQSPFQFTQIPHEIKLTAKSPFSHAILF